MSIQKKSLISTLKTTKKANLAKGDLSHAGSAGSGVKAPTRTLARVMAGKKGIVTGKMKNPLSTSIKGIR